jgi:hypothetical protein
MCVATYENNDDRKTHPFIHFQIFHSVILFFHSFGQFRSHSPRTVMLLTMFLDTMAKAAGEAR